MEERNANIDNAELMPLTDVEAYNKMQATEKYQKTLHTVLAENDHITPKDMTARKVWPLFVFTLCEVIFGCLMYGSVIPHMECNMYSSSFEHDCTHKGLFIAQAVIYFLLIMIFCCVGDLRFVIFKQMTKVDVLLFPLVIIIILAVTEGLYVLLYWERHEGWMFLHLITRTIAYILWFSYAPILGNVPRFAGKIERTTFMAHIVFGHIAAFGIIWMTITLFVFDFTFAEEEENAVPMTIVLVMLAGILIIEWMHVVIESWLHDEDYEHYFEEYMSSHQLQQLSEFDTRQHTHRQQPKQEAAKTLLMDGCKCDCKCKCNGNIAFYLSFICLLISYFFFDLITEWPLAEPGCTEFQVGKSLEMCYDWSFYVEFAFVTFSLLLLLIRFCVMPQDEFSLIAFQMRRLHFPFAIWMIVWFIGMMFTWLVNPYYLVVTITTNFFYIVMFIQGLFVIVARIYKKTSRDVDNIFCSKNLRIFQLITWLFFLMCLWKIIMNFVTDVISVEEAAEHLHHEYGVAISTVHTLVFLQIQFENVLLTEYLHVIFGSIEHDQYIIYQ